MSSEPVNLSNKHDTSSIVLSIVLTFILALTLGAFIGAFSVLGWKKHCYKPDIKSPTPSPKYDDTVIPSLLTESNPSYNANKPIESAIDNLHQVSEPVRSISGTGPLYEDLDNIIYSK